MSTLTPCYNLICDCQLLLDFSSANDYFKFLTKYLATFSGEDASTLSEAKEEAVHAIVEFVKAPNMFKVVSFVVNNILKAIFTMV